jgi:hypothetical protein
MSDEEAGPVSWEIWNAEEMRELEQTRATQDGRGKPLPYNFGGMVGIALRLLAPNERTIYSRCFAGAACFARRNAMG